MSTTITRWGSKQMKDVIERIAKKHGVDLSQGGSLRLDQPGYDRLCIQWTGPNRVSVAHYFEQNGDLVADPEIVFDTSFIADRWVPVEITQVLTGWRQVETPRAMADAASFANIWARNLKFQGWASVETPTRKRINHDA